MVPLIDCICVAFAQSELLAHVEALDTDPMAYQAIVALPPYTSLGAPDHVWGNLTQNIAAYLNPDSLVRLSNDGE